MTVTYWAQDLVVLSDDGVENHRTTVNGELDFPYQPGDVDASAFITQLDVWRSEAVTLDVELSHQHRADNTVTEDRWRIELSDGDTTIAVSATERAWPSTETVA